MTGSQVDLHGTPKYIAYFCALFQPVYKLIKSLNPVERKAFLIHLGYSLIEGIILGVLALNEFVLIKSLKGTDFQIGILFQLSVILMLFSIILNEWIRRIQYKKRLIRTVSLVTRLPLLLLLLFPRSVEGVTEQPLFGLAFLGIFLLFYLANPIIYPLINLFLKTSYRHENFGRLYSYATSLNKIVMLVFTFLFGVYLDHDPYAFRVVYPVLAGLGLISLNLLALMPYKEQAVEKATTGFMTSIIDSIKRSYRILFKNKPYRDFEIGFMLYGFAWMTTIAVITIFFEYELHLNYTSVAFYKNAYNLLAILLLPLFGKLIGKIDPRRFAIITFSSLLFFLFFMGLTEYVSGSFDLGSIKVYYMLIPSYLSHAVFAATMSLLWFIGSSYFSKPHEAADYQSVHLTLTGARGLFAPLVGVMFYEWLGFSWTFGIAVTSLAIAVIVMLVSMRRHPVPAT